jgi:hypothetical protein
LGIGQSPIPVTQVIKFHISIISYHILKLYNYKNFNKFLL